MADYEGYLDIDGLIERLKELAAASGHHISKKEKAKLKTSFKEILHSIEVRPGDHGRILNHPFTLTSGVPAVGISASRNSHGGQHQDRL